MSETERRLKPGDVAALMKRDGEYKETASLVRNGDSSFVPWSKAKYPVLDPNASLPTPEGETQAEEAAAEDVAAQEAPAPAAEEEHLPPPPPPPPQHDGPSADEIVQAIENAREEGRVKGYHEGVAAARAELQEALEAVRRIEAGLLEAAAEAADANAVVVARHVRRIAQDLAGTMLAEMPQSFMERIRRSADLFTRSGAEFTLSLNARDAATLGDALKGDPLFATIRVIEDHDVPAGAFRLISRDLEYQDSPHLDGVPE